MLSVSDRHLAQQLAANNAIIIRTKRADAYPAYAAESGLCAGSVMRAFAA